MLIGGLIRFEEYLAGQLMELLGDEVKNSIPCELTYDSASISLIRLTGKASNARVVCSGEVFLQFKEIQADFSLGKIFNHIIELTHLRLLNGHSNGVGPDSPTYQFIDYLSAPIPPEHDRPGRWKLQLERLSVESSTFIEDLGTNLLSATGVRLEMHYNEDRDAILSPTIDSVEYVIRGKHPRTMPLGGASSAITISDTTTNFKDLLLSKDLNASTLNADAFRSKHNILSGTASHKAALAYVGLPDWLVGTLIGTSTVKGVLASPILEGSFKNDKTLQTKIAPGNFDVVKFEDLSGHFLVDFNHRKPIIKVTELAGSSPDAKLSSSKGITINDDAVSGGLDLSTKSIVIGPVEFADINAHIELSGTLGDVQTHSTGTVGEIKTLGAVVHRTTFDAFSHGDDVNFTSVHNAPGGGALNAEGTINLAAQEPVMKQVTYKVSSFPFLSLYKDTLSPESHSVLLLNGEGIVKGPFHPAEVQTKASLTATSSVLPIPAGDNSGTFEVSKGKLSLNFGKQSFFKLALGVTDQDTKGTLLISFPQNSPIDQLTKLRCSSFTSDLSYTFERSSPWSGSGITHVKDLVVGCPADSLILPQPVQIPIQNGAMVIKNVSLKGADSDLKVSGSLGVNQGWDLSTNGLLHLKTFQGLLPAADELSGTATISLKASGKISDPHMQGLVQIQDGSIFIESSNIDVQDVSGFFDFNGDVFVARDIHGILNGGKVTYSGAIYPFNMSRTSLIAKIEGATFSPLPNVALLVSGELGLITSNDAPPLISGKLSVDNAEFEKRIDLITIAKSLTDLLFAKRQAESRSKALPDINLQVDVFATRNIFIVTNYFGSELKSNLHISGTLASPQVTGTMESLSGWFGLKDHRFDISSGVITFNGSVTEPTLSLIGESVIRAKTGETINVYLEAKGPLIDPKVTFSSDSSLSQRDILTLLTSGSQSSEETLVNTIGKNVELTGYSPLEDIPILNYSKFLKNLTHIDSLSVEPQYNISTGTIEPFVSARKRLADLLSIVGESYLGGQSSDTRVGLIYNLFPNLNVAGYLANSTDNTNLASEIDVTLTVLASQKKFVSFKIEGNEVFSKSRILALLKLGPSSRILPGDMFNLRQNIKKFYRSRGYFDARIQSWCKIGLGYCHFVRIKITEGPQSFIHAVRIEGSNKVPDELIPYAAVKSEAVGSILVKTRDSILRWARSEGYISSRVDSLYSRVDQNQQDMLIKVDLGNPVTFKFEGNSVFSPEDFLESINLFGRKVPFGNNTINILLRNINQMYREKGYLHIATSKDAFTDPETGRITYKISITEGDKITVHDVSFRGLRTISESRLEEFVKKEDLSFYRSLYLPEYAVEEVIEANQDRVVKLLKAHGFPDAAVSHELTEDKSHGTLSIIYTISEGSEEPSYTLAVSGLPAIPDALPDIPKGVVKLSLITKYLDQLQTALAENAYRAPAIETEKDPAGTFSIIVSPGHQTTLRAISYEGLQDVSREAINNLINLHLGDPINSRSLGEIRQKLLNHGLFSRVEIIEADTLEPEVKDLTFRFAEKPLTTLDVGGGFNSEFGVHVFGEGTDRSFFADGRALILRLDAYVHSPAGETISKGIASLKYSDPSILGTRYTLTEDLRFQKFNTSTLEFDLQRTAFVSSLYRAWNNGLTLSFGHTISTETLNHVSPDVILSKYDSGTLFLGYLSQTLQYDHRDNPLNPYRGYTLSLENKFASQFFGSEASFDELSSHASYLYPFFLGENQFVFAQSARAGTGWLLGSTDFIPISQRYYLGGRNSVRGYKENSLGPRGAQEGVLGGDSSLQNTFEFQYRPNDFASINLFFDSGNVYLRNFDSIAHSVPADLQKEDETFLRYSSGIGLRYLSPIGPIGLDLGFPLNKRETDDPWRVHFNIGTNF